MNICTKDNTKCILRHGLVYWFNAVTHCKFIHNLLSCLIKIHLPGIISFGIGDLHHPIPLHICEMVKEVLKYKTGMKLYAKLLKLPSEFHEQLGIAKKEALTHISLLSSLLPSPYPVCIFVLWLAFLLACSQLNFSTHIPTILTTQHCEWCRGVLQCSEVRLISFLKPTHFCPLT